MEQITLQPTELRIGNKLIRNGIIVIIDGRSIFDISFNEKIASEYSPIPLTPDILEKCKGMWLSPFGDYIISVYPHKSGNGFRNLIFCGDYLYLEEGSDKLKPQERDVITLWNKDLMKQFYLHQLQNLYFTLCGKELEITL